MESLNTPTSLDNSNATTYLHPSKPRPRTHTYRDSRQSFRYTPTSIPSDELENQRMIAFFFLLNFSPRPFLFIHKAKQIDHGLFLATY
jgi:hypothetical protein